MDESRRSTAPPKETTGRVCTVCSDRANGYNFGVLTCESCKAFFRRNAAKHQEIKCPFSNSCQITSASRKFCQACRLNKCFSVGMNSDWLNETRPRTVGKFKRKKTMLVQTLKTEEQEEEEKQEDEEENVSVPKALLEKLMQKAADSPKEHCTCTCRCGFYPPSQKLTATTPTPTATQPLHHPDSFSFPTPSHSSMISSTPSPPVSSSYGTPQQVAEMSPMVNQNDQQLVSPFQTGVMPQMSGAPTWNACEETPDLLTRIHKKIDKYTSILSRDEMKLLEELHVQNEPLNAPLSRWYNPSSIDGVIRIIEEALRRIVNMACQLNLFRELHADDRKNLLKSGFCELLIVRGVMAFNKGDQSWNHSFGVAGKMEVKIDMLNDPKTKDHYEVHKRLLDTFGDDVRNNENLMLIFNAIVIFHPHVSNLRDSKRVHATQAKYFEMLYKILAFEYDNERAERAYKNLLNQVVDLHRVNHTMLRIFYGLDISQLDPLIRELCSFE